MAVSIKVPPPPDFAAEWIRLEGNVTELARHYGVGRAKARAWRNEVIPEAAATNSGSQPAMHGGTLTKTIELADLPTGRPAEMLRERDLDPEAWRITSATINEWLQPDGTLAPQTKIHLAPRKDLLVPARAEGWRPPKPKKPRKKAPHELAVVLPDAQAPFQDDVLHERVLFWLEKNQPATIVCNGDGMDLPSVSRHRRNRRFDATVQECIDARYRMLADYRSVCPNAEIVEMEGNHDIRLANYTEDHAPELVGIGPACTGENAHAMTHLLRLDELHVTWIGDYPAGQWNLSSKLAVRHGWKAQRGSGASALATLEDLGFAVIVGHTHRQGLVFKTVRGIDGEMHVLAACEAGTLARIDEGLGHTDRANWQQGFATAEVHPNGDYHLELATFAGGRLRWRDQII